MLECLQKTFFPHIFVWIVEKLGSGTFEILLTGFALLMLECLDRLGRFPCNRNLNKDSLCGSLGLSDIRQEGSWTVRMI